MKSIAIGAIQIYQKVFSPVVGRACRFTPTCSVYTGEAIKKYGVGKGIVLGMRRIARCHPFSRGGFDPLDPERGGLTSAHHHEHSRIGRRAES